MTTPRQFIRHHSSAPREPLDIVTALRDALASDGAVEFYDHVEGIEPPLVFTLWVHGIAIRIMAADGRCIGVFASALEAALHGFEVLDHATALPAPPPTRLTRKRRQATGARP